MINKRLEYKIRWVSNIPLTKPKYNFICNLFDLDIYLNNTTMANSPLDCEINFVKMSGIRGSLGCFHSTELETLREDYMEIIYALKYEFKKENPKILFNKFKKYLYRKNKLSQEAINLINKLNE